MARRKLTLPLALIAGVGAGVAGPIQMAMGGDVQGALEHLAWHYTGWIPQEGRFDPAGIQRGLVPLLIGAVVHKYVGGAPLNVNRALAAAGVPILRI